MRYFLPLFSKQNRIALVLLFLTTLLFADVRQIAAGELPPRADDSFWRDSIPASMRESYVAYGEQYLDKPWVSLSLHTFAEFKDKGNRVNYEGLCFAKRRQLAALVMAEIVEGKGRFMSAIVDGLASFSEETWWGIPAHYRTKVPRTEDQTVDLFNAETAGLVAWTRYMLQSQLDAFSPLLCQRIDQEIERRLLKPAVETDYWWKKAGMNWNPWICSNWLACILLTGTEEDRWKGETGTLRREGLKQIEQAAKTFVDSYPEDGGCDEGPGYWDRAAASLFEVVSMLDEHSCASLMPKIKRMAAYAYKTYIGNGYVLSFADSHDNRYMQQLNIVYPFACWIDDPVMRGFAKYIGDDKDYLHYAADLYDRSGNFPTLGRELMFLCQIRSFQREEAREPLLRDVWLPDLQIMTARRGSLFVAMKGGHNDESHNHNDVGEFVVYATDSLCRPLFIDMGVGEYTSKTFSKERYDIWTMQSQYHNLPQINGCDQKDGKTFSTRVVRRHDGQLTLDLSGAYPATAGVKAWQRTVTARKAGVSVTEDYELETVTAPTRLMLISVARPELTREGVISLDCHRLVYNPRQLSASIEDISDKLDPLLQGIWGQKMYRIVLTIKSAALKNKLSYRIE